MVIYYAAHNAALANVADSKNGFFFVPATDLAYQH